MMRIQFKMIILDVFVPLPPNMFDVLPAVALPNRFEPKLFDGDACAAPPKMDAVLVLLFGVAAFPKIFCAGFAAAGDAKILPVETDGLIADEVGLEAKPKPPNDNDALSTAFEPKMFSPGDCCTAGESGLFAPNKGVELDVTTALALLVRNVNFFDDIFFF